MLPGNMDIIDLSSDEDDFNFDSDDPIDGVDQQPVSSNVTFHSNSGGPPIRFQDEDWLKSAPESSSSRPAESRFATRKHSEVDNFHGLMNNGLNMGNGNDQYRTLPLSLANGRHIENAYYKAPAGSLERTYPHSGSSVAMARDYASTIPTAPRINSVGKKNNGSSVDANNNNKRILPPSLSNGSAAKSIHSNVSSGACQFPAPSFTNGNSRKLGENKTKEDFSVKSTPLGRNVNGTGMASSSMAMGQIPFMNSSQKVVTEDDDDDIYVYSGGPSSHRVLPPSFASSTSANNVVNGLDMQSRPNLEDRLLDSDERAVYQEALQHISQDKREDDLPEGVLSVSLLKHQKMALAWMVSKENSSHCAGGILADDQGLGKTVSTIALIQKQRVQQSKFMSVDSSRLKSEALNLDEDDETVTVVDRKDEPKKDLEASTSSTTFPVTGTAGASSDLKLCASQAETVPDRMVQAVKIESKKQTRASTPSSASARSMTRPAAGTLVVCPASVLKQWANELTDKVTESGKLSVLVYHGGSRTRDPSELAKYDVVITTYTIVTNEVPKQNADDETEQKNGEKYGISPEFSAGNKRRPQSNAQGKGKKKKKKLKDSDIDHDSGPIARVRWFRVVLDEAQTIKNHRTQVARACCGLRAKRRWCLSGTPIQNTIDDLYSYFRFLKYDPYSTYSSFCSNIKHPISRNSNLGYRKLQTVLRTVLLRRTKETLIDGEPIIKLPPKTVCLNKVDFNQEERSFYSTLEERSRQQFRQYAAAGTVKQNYASILLLLLRLRQACNHPLLVKGHQSEFVGNGSIEMARQLPKEMVINLLAKLEEGSSICTICSDPPEDASVAMCGHVFCYQCIYERITSDENVCPSAHCRNTISAESVFSSAALKICISDNSSSSATSSAADDGSSSICGSSYISSKIQAAVDILNSIINTHALTESDTVSSSSQVAPVKAIVFSQWTGMLDLLELSLNSNLIQYRRLDGTMSLNSRDRAVKDFSNDPEVRVMLMSLKAGNLGLNMVAACHVILLDPWWNPYAEDQAVDRAHRIGQTRPVTVSRLTITDSVEDRILALQEEKRTVVNSAFGEDKSSGHATRLTLEDLRYLFKM